MNRNKKTFGKENLFFSIYLEQQARNSHTVSFRQADGRRIVESFKEIFH